jgi:hypothetical protein
MSAGTRQMSSYQIYKASESANLREFIRDRYVLYLEKKQSRSIDETYTAFRDSLKREAQTFAVLQGHLNGNVNMLIDEYDRLASKGCLDFCCSAQSSLDLFVRDEFSRFIYKNRHELSAFLDTAEFYETNQVPLVESLKNNIEASATDLAKQFGVSIEKVLESIDDWHSMFYLGNFGALYE